MRTSTNGSTWTTVTSNFLKIESIAYGNGLWVASGMNLFDDFGSGYYSTDAINWTSFSFAGFSTLIYSIAYGDGLWVAGGATGQMRTSQEILISDTPTINSKDSNNKISSQYGAATLYKRSTNEWILIGDLTS
jgi:hypothetical protein